MQKDFDSWNEVKKELETKIINFNYKEREVWWCSVGINTGTESCGKGEKYRRPILIIKKLSNNACIGLPLSKQIKKGSWYYTIKINNEMISIILSQIRTYDTRRLQRKLYRIDSLVFDEIKKKLDHLIELFNYHQK